MFNRREVMCRWAVNAAVDRNVPRTAQKSVDFSYSLCLSTISSAVMVL